MRTFAILTVGWIAGAGVLLLFDAASNVPVQSAVSAPAAETATAAASSRPSASGLLIPVVGVSANDLRDDFNQPRGGGRTHHALDILAPLGTPVVAAVDGTVRKLFTSRAGGLTIYQFDRDEARVYYYAHLDRYADGLREGNHVVQGAVIGYVGTTGNTGGTPHLHFSVEELPPTKEWWKGSAINPFPLLTAAR